MYGGLLGVGKTTVIQQLLQNGYEKYRVVIIENEIGKVNLDAAYLRKSGIAVREMTGGCICCTISGQLSEAVRDIVKNYHPDFVIMEPSGAADIRAIQKELRSIREVSEGRSVLIVNAKKTRSLLAVVGDFFLEQIRCAGLIYLNRADGMTPETLENVKKEILAINPSVRFVERPISELTLDDFPPMEEAENAARKNAADLSVPVRPAAELTIRDIEEPKRLEFGKKKESILYTWIWKLPDALTAEQLMSVREMLTDPACGEIWRAKGVLRMKDGTLHKIDYVFGDYSEEELPEPLSVSENEIVLIGRKINRERISAFRTSGK